MKKRSNKQQAADYNKEYRANGEVEISLQVIKVRSKG
jgi:hypothetical protein